MVPFPALIKVTRATSSHTWIPDWNRFRKHILFLKLRSYHIPQTLIKHTAPETDQYLSNTMGIKVFFKNSCINASLRQAGTLLSSRDAFIIPITHLANIPDHYSFYWPKKTRNQHTCGSSLHSKNPVLILRLYTWNLSINTEQEETKLHL